MSSSSLLLDCLAPFLVAAQDDEDRRVLDAEQSTSRPLLQKHTADNYESRTTGNRRRGEPPTNWNVRCSEAQRFCDAVRDNEDRQRAEESKSGTIVTITIRAFLSHTLDADFSHDRAVADSDFFVAPERFGIPVLFPKLKVLILTGCRLKTFDHLGPLTDLTQLFISDNELFTIPETIASSFPALEFLDLAGNRVTSFVETGKLATLPKLRSLDLGRNPILSAIKSSNQSKSNSSTTFSSSSPSASLLHDDDVLRQQLQIEYQILYLVPQLQRFNQKEVGKTIQKQVRAGILPTATAADCMQIQTAREVVVKNQERLSLEDHGADEVLMSSAATPNAEADAAAEQKNKTTKYNHGRSEDQSRHGGNEDYFEEVGEEAAAISRVEAEIYDLEKEILASTTRTTAPKTTFFPNYQSGGSSSSTARSARKWRQEEEQQQHTQREQDLHQINPHDSKHGHKMNSDFHFRQKLPPPVLFMNDGGSSSSNKSSGAPSKSLSSKSSASSGGKKSSSSSSAPSGGGGGGPGSQSQEQQQWADAETHQDGEEKFYDPRPTSASENGGVHATTRSSAASRGEAVPGEQQEGSRMGGRSTSSRIQNFSVNRASANEVDKGFVEESDEEVAAAQVDHRKTDQIRASAASRTSATSRSAGNNGSRAGSAVLQQGSLSSASFAQHQDHGAAQDEMNQPPFFTAFEASPSGAPFEGPQVEDLSPINASGHSKPGMLNYNALGDSVLLQSVSAEATSPSSSRVRKAHFDLLHRMISPSHERRRPNRVHHPSGFGFGFEPRGRKTSTPGGIDHQYHNRLQSTSPHEEVRTISPLDERPDGSLAYQLQQLLSKPENEEVVRLALQKAGRDFSIDPKNYFENNGMKDGITGNRKMISKQNLIRQLLKEPSCFVDVFLQLCLHIIEEKEKHHLQQYGKDHFPFGYPGHGAPKYYLGGRGGGRRSRSGSRSRGTRSAAASPYEEQFGGEENNYSNSYVFPPGTNSNLKTPGVAAGTISRTQKHKNFVPANAEELSEIRQETVARFLESKKFTAANSKSTENDNSSSSRRGYLDDEEDEDEEPLGPQLFPNLSARRENLKKMCLPNRLFRAAARRQQEQPIHARWQTRYDNDPELWNPHDDSSLSWFQKPNSPEERANEHQLHYYHFGKPGAGAAGADASKHHRHQTHDYSTSSRHNLPRAVERDEHRANGGPHYAQSTSMSRSKASPKEKTRARSPAGGDMISGTTSGAQLLGSAASQGGRSTPLYSNIDYMGPALTATTPGSRTGKTGKNRTRSRPQMTNQLQMTSREQEPCFDESSIYSRDFFDILGTTASKNSKAKQASAAASIVNAMSMSANPRYQYGSTQPLVNAKIIRGNRHRLGNPLKGRDVGVVPGTGIGRKHLIGGVWK
ncbi:unnamed protein product [Amoebophrya sp. A120]|nr:unnamed protein product [Amoebophrya sp. A120]|eukprot:GSA120T00004472001.1